jgi:hypothetical protein
MPNKHNAKRRHHIPKMKFKVRNWKGRCCTAKCLIKVEIMPPSPNRSCSQPGLSDGIGFSCLEHTIKYSYA